MSVMIDDYLIFCLTDFLASCLFELVAFLVDLKPSRHTVIRTVIHPTIEKYNQLTSQKNIQPSPVSHTSLDISNQPSIHPSIQLTSQTFRQAAFQPTTQLARDTSLHPGIRTNIHPCRELNNQSSDLNAYQSACQPPSELDYYPISDLMSEPTSQTPAS